MVIGLIVSDNVLMLSLKDVLLFIVNVRCQLKWNSFAQVWTKLVDLETWLKYCQKYGVRILSNQLINLIMKDPPPLEDVFCTCRYVCKEFYENLIKVR